MWIVALMICYGRCHTTVVSYEKHATEQDCRITAAEIVRYPEMKKPDEKTGLIPVDNPTHGWRCLYVP